MVARTNPIGNVSRLELDSGPFRTGPYAPLHAHGPSERWILRLEVDLLHDTLAVNQLCHSRLRNIGIGRRLARSVRLML